MKEGKQTHSATHSQGAIGPGLLQNEKDISVFVSGVTWYIAHILRQAPFTGVIGQHKQDYIFLRKREVRDGGLRENLIRGGGYNKIYEILKE